MVLIRSHSASVKTNRWTGSGVINTCPLVQLVAARRGVFPIGSADEYLLVLIIIDRNSEFSKLERGLALFAYHNSNINL